MRKDYRKFIARCTALVACMVLVSCNLIIPVHGMTTEERLRWQELLAQGYSFEVVQDQIQEEYNGLNGTNHTGGIDGKYLDGTVAPKNEIGLTVTPKPTPTPPTPTTQPTEPPKPAHIHEYTRVEVVKQETCTEDGISKGYCECGATVEGVRPALGHEYEIVKERCTEATCQELAVNVFVCTDCGDEVIQPYGDLAPHSYKVKDGSTEPTCTEGGHVVYVCEVCGDEYEEDKDALGHSFPDAYNIIRKATCTEAGAKNIICERCGEVKEGSEVSIPAVGHVESPNHTIVEPGLFEDGKETVTCLTCNAVLSETVLPKTIDTVIKKYGIVIGGGVVLLVGAISALVVVFIKKRKK